MPALLHELAQIDRLVLDMAHSLRWEPLTLLLVVTSAWWVKGPLIVCAGGLADVRCRRLLPLAAGSAATAALLGAAAAAVGMLHPRLRWPLLGLAALVGFSRVYLGVHYGLDVLAGAVLGTVVGVASAFAISRVLRRRAERPATI